MKKDDDDAPPLPRLGAWPLGVLLLLRRRMSPQRRPQSRSCVACGAREGGTKKGRQSDRPISFETRTPTLPSIHPNPHASHARTRAWVRLLLPMGPRARSCRRRCCCCWWWCRNPPRRGAAGGPACEGEGGKGQQCFVCFGVSRVEGGAAMFCVLGGEQSRRGSIKWTPRSLSDTAIDDDDGKIPVDLNPSIHPSPPPSQPASQPPSLHFTSRRRKAPFPTHLLLEPRGRLPVRDAGLGQRGQQGVGQGEDGGRRVAPLRLHLRLAPRDERRERLMGLCCVVFVLGRFISYYLHGGGPAATQTQPTITAPRSPRPPTHPPTSLHSLFLPLSLSLHPTPPSSLTPRLTHLPRVLPVHLVLQRRRLEHVHRLHLVRVRLRQEGLDGLGQQRARRDGLRWIDWLRGGGGKGGRGMNK